MRPSPSIKVADTCRGDAICVEVCPKSLLEIHEGKARAVEEATSICMACGHCAAICPTGALALEGWADATLSPTAAWNIPFVDLMAFLRSRRSVRVFADKPVNRALIDRILDAAEAAPPAFPPQTTEVLVIDRREDLDELTRTLVTSYDKLLKLFRNPIARFIIRRKRGELVYHSLRTHVLNIIRWDNQRFRSKGFDGYTYGAPVVMLFHADQWVTGHSENAILAATYAMLAAHALGLGATMLSIVPPALNNIAHELRHKYGIPKANTVELALIVGHPKYKFRRAILRPLKVRRYLDDRDPLT